MTERLAFGWMVIPDASWRNWCNNAISGH